MLGLGSNCEILVCCAGLARHCNVSSEVRVEQWSRRVGVHSGNIETECGDWGAFHHHLHHPHPHHTVAALTLTNTLAD